MIPSNLSTEGEAGNSLSGEQILLLSPPLQQPTGMNIPTSPITDEGEGQKSLLVHSSGEKPFLSPPPPPPPPPSQKQQKKPTRMNPFNVATREDSFSPPPPPPPPPSWRRSLKRKTYLAREDKEEEEEEEDQEEEELEVEAAAPAVGSSSFPGVVAPPKPYYLSSSDSLKRSRSSRFPSWSCKADYPDMKDALEAVYEELEMERRASTTAVNEALAMIARLQEEKSYLGMAACQYRRFAEEREAHDLETIALLEDLLVQEKSKGSVIDSPDGILDRRPMHPRHNHLMALALKPQSEIEVDDESEEKHIISLPGADENSTSGDGSRSEETYRQDNLVSLDFASSSSFCDEDSLDQKVGAMSNKDEISVTAQESPASSVWDRIRNLDERLHILSEHQKQMLSLDFEPTTAGFPHPDPHRMESTQNEFYKTREWSYETPKDFQDKVVEIYEVQRERESNLLEDSEEVQEIHSTKEEIQNLQGFGGEQKYFQHSMHNYHDRISNDKQLAYIMATRKWLNERIKAHCKPSHSSSSNNLNGKMDQSHQLAEEVEILSVKLQHVKAERDSMMQEILSLRSENNELKAAEDVSKQLREMRGSNENKAGPSHVGISTQQEGSFLLLLFKAFLSFIGLHHKRLDFEKYVEAWNPEENEGMLEMQRLRMTRRASTIGRSLASNESPITINEASALQYRPISNLARDRDFSAFILRWLCV